MKKHPNKHVQAAIEYAIENGWVWVTAGNSSHTFCKLRCGNAVGEHKTTCDECLVNAKSYGSAC